METWIECVPNVSEGRRPEVVARLVDAVASTPGIRYLNTHIDADHNRSVLTFAGQPAALKTACGALVDEAIRLIDMRLHSGEHPRLGAVDVIPFIPWKGATMEDCVQLAWQVGDELGHRFDLPVYFYEAAARRPSRRNLADVRRGGMEALAGRMTDDEHAPDAGPRTVHPTAGATAIGARDILVAYNVNLNTNDLKVARAIARRIRGRDGGFTGVKAMGVRLESRGIVQVSMNLVDVRRTSIYTVFETIRMEARRFGVEVLESELVGMLPAEALVDVARYYLRLDALKPSHLLEVGLGGPRDE